MGVVARLRRRPGPAARSAGRLLDLAFPAACAGCGREGTPLCAACGRALAARAGAPAGVPLGMPSDVPLPLVQLEWCAPYGGLVRDALHALKYARRAAAGRRRSARRWPRAGARRRSAATCSSPCRSTPRGARARGYDQAELLARAAAAALGLPGAARAPARARDGAPVRAGPRRRAANVAAAFVVARASAAARRRPLGRARRRRRDDRRDAGRLRRGAPGRRGGRRLGADGRARGVTATAVDRGRPAGRADGPRDRAARPSELAPVPAYTRPDRAAAGRRVPRTGRPARTLEVSREDDRQGQEHRRPGRRAAVRRAEDRDAWSASSTTGPTRSSSSPSSSTGAPTTRGSRTSRSSSTARRSAGGRTRST